MKLLLSLPLLFTFLSISSHAESTIPTQPKLIQSYKLKNKPNAGNFFSTDYKVTIKTSCNSTSYTTDKIELKFGDSFGQKGYKSFDSVASGVFEWCSKDSFTVNGDYSLFGICYAYLKRDGADGWLPESLKIEGPWGKSLTVDYKLKQDSLPEGLWVGGNKCGGGVSTENMLLAM